MSTPAVTEQNARIISEQFVKQVQPYPGTFSGRGIVTCAGGRYFTSAWVMINLVRHLGCKLPIQLWHLGKHEFDSDMQALVEPLGVECIDASEVRKRFPARILNGWEMKPYSIIHSPFKEVLFIDADNLPVVNPEFLYEIPEYQNAGALFWPDFGRLAPTRSIWALTGVAYRDEHEFESGQMLVDKERCWLPLALCMWYNEHSDLFYSHVYGDKETFHMAFRKLNADFAIPKQAPDYIHGMVHQYDFNGRLIFQHQSKWDYFRSREAIGQVHADLCLQFLAQLREQWCGLSRPIDHYCAHKSSERAKRIADDLTSGLFSYHREGFDERLIAFSIDGTVGLGNGACETYWDLNESNGRISLEILSESELTCRLHQRPDGSWIGHWECHEQMPVQLAPVLGDLMSYPTFRLQARLPVSGRRSTILHLLAHLNATHDDDPVIVEIGTIMDPRLKARGTDGWSTFLFGWYASEFGAEIHTVDQSSFSMEICRKVTEPYSNLIQYHVKDGIEFLSQFEKPISLLYLDAWDGLQPDSEFDCLEAFYNLAHRPRLIAVDDIPSGKDLNVISRRILGRLLSDGYRIMVHSENQICLVDSRETQSK